MTPTDEDYRQLRRLPPDGRRAWLAARGSITTNPQWWLALVDSAETDCGLTRDLADGERRTNLEFAASLVDLAVRCGAWRPTYAVSWLCRLVRIAMASEVPPPGVLNPDSVAARGLAAIPLTVDQAVAAAARVRATPDGDAADVDEPVLREIHWLVPGLADLLPYLREESVAVEVTRWVDAMPRLSFLE